MDAFRYFLLREMPFGQDAKFSEEALVTRINADLANNLGNLVSRVLTMEQKYFGGVVQPLSSNQTAEDRDLQAKFAWAEKEREGYMRDLQFHRALEALWSALDQANRYIVQTAPFTLIKDPDKESRVGEVLHHLLEGLRVLSRLLAPFLPDTSAELLVLLGVSDEGAAVRDSSLNRSLEAPWGRFFERGHKVKAPKVLFPRIEMPAEA
jgi:methionyl-tRNA synthetase